MAINKHHIALATGILVLLTAGLFTTSYFGRKSPGITEVQIPPETKEYLEQLAQKIGDLRFSKREGSGKDRTNKDDDEQADERGFRKVASENFVVYYHAADRQRAEQTLQYAEDSRGRMEQVFNYFPYAKDKGGRKLPVYLASSEKEYYTLAKVDISSAACVHHDVYDDAMVATMYVSPTTFSQGDDAARIIITHEVAHYTHFSLVNPRNIRNLRMWLTEGLADYTAQEKRRLQQLHSAFRAGKVVPITELTAYSDSSAYHSPDVQLYYAEGHSVLQMVEDRNGRRAVTALILTASQKTDISGAVSQVLSFTLGELNQIWFNYLSSSDTEWR